MIRVESTLGWALVTHPDHARLAGALAEAWGNADFERPSPFAPVLLAVQRHDDGWIARDQQPFLTAEGKPAAFTASLVGAYAAFEEIDLPRYLEVRGAATESVAKESLHAGVLVSMHTVNLLTERANLATIRPEHRAVHRAFVEDQRRWQASALASLGLPPEALRQGFEFLQTCDNLSLVLCANYTAPTPLCHAHGDRHGTRHVLRCTGSAGAVWRISPWPFATPEVELAIPQREVAHAACVDQDTFRQAFAEAPVVARPVRLLPG